MPLEIQLTTTVHTPHIMLIDGVLSAAYRLFLPSSGGAYMAPLPALAHVKEAGHKKLEHLAVARISGLVTCQPNGEILIDANCGGIESCRGGKPTPRDSQLFTIVGTIQSLCGLGERCLLVETERSFTTSSYIGLTLQAYPKEVYGKFDTGRVVQATARYDHLAAPVQDKTANVLVFAPQYIQDVSVHATTLPYTISAHSALPNVAMGGKNIVNAKLDPAFQMIVSRPQKRRRQNSPSSTPVYIDISDDD